MDLEAAAVKWVSACALLLDFELFQGQKLPSLRDALQGARRVSGLRQLQVRYLGCPRPKTLTIWVRTCGIRLGVRPAQNAVRQRDGLSCAGDMHAGAAQALEAAAISVPDILPACGTCT